MDRPSMVTVDRYYLDELKRKALAWDQLQKELGEMHAARIQDDMNYSLSPDDGIDTARAVPLDQTIIVTNLPSTIGGAELMYSFLAPGGIRCYKLFFEPGKGKNSLTALITFATSNAAKDYVSYVSKHGVFFTSEKLTEGYLGPPEMGEYLRASADERIRFLLKPLPDVTINPWLGIEKITGNIINGDEGGYCDVAQEMKKGATRVLLIFPGMDAKQVHEELRHLAAIPELKIELNRLLPAMPPREGKVTIIRFCSVRDAVMAKTYLSFLKAFSGSGGRTVEYCKDPIDRPTEDLDWHKLAIPGEKNESLMNSDSNPAAAKVASQENEVPVAENHIPICPPYWTTDAEVEESDDESEMRELSFSLAKEAFLPHIPTSPTRECFPTLCHTPAPGEQTPAPGDQATGDQVPTELELQPVTETPKPILPKTNENIIPVIIIEEPDESTPRRPRYPHEMFLSQGRAAGKKKAGALKKMPGNTTRLKNTISSPDLSWASGSVSGIETLIDKPTTVSPNFQPLGHPLKSISPNPITKAVKPPFTEHETTLEKYRKEEQQLLNTAATPEKLAKTTKIFELEKQALGFEDQNQTLGVPKSIDLPWKRSPTDNISASGEDNFLGGWGDDF